jgi:ABC-type dipeptide/oligopeptide/nickel transport system ATPase subunit
VTDESFDFGVKFVHASDRLAEERKHRERLARRVLPFNIAFLDDCCYGIYPTDLIVICAASGAGKTTVAALVSQLAAAQGRNVHFFALEAHRSEIEQRMLFREICQLLFAERGYVGTNFAEWMYGRADVSDAIEEEARARLVEQTPGLKTFYRERRFTPEDITRLFLAIQNETDLIVLDHLHYVDTDDRDENRALKAATKAIRDVALDMEKPRLIPDIDDVHGSSEIVKVATKVIMLAPARDRIATELGVANTYMEVVKDRFAGRHYLAALLRYDMRSLRYQDQYILGRINFNGDKFENLAADQMPRWAKHGLALGTPDMFKDVSP